MMDDVISRKAAIDAIKTWGLIDGLSEGQAIEILADEEKLPPAQPQKRTKNARMRAIVSADRRRWMPIPERGDSICK